MKICIIIPIYNESKNIGQIVKAIKDRGNDIVVIDDGSNDGSGDIARENGAVVLRHEAKRGKGQSLQDGFQYVVKQDYSGVITMDGDAQHDVGDIKNFEAALSNNKADIVVGNRMDDCSNMPFVRRMTNKFMSFLISLVCKQKVHDTQCGFRYISREVLENVKFDSSAFEIESEILIKASRKGYTIISAPIKTIYGDEESKINPVRDTFRFFKYILKEIFSGNKE